MKRYLAITAFVAVFVACWLCVAVFSRTECTERLEKMQATINEHELKLEVVGAMSGKAYRDVEEIKQCLGERP